MMRTLIVAAVAALAALPAAAQVRITSWQQLQPYIAAQTAKLNTHTDEIARLTSDMGLVIQRYDMLLRAIIANVCASNAMIAQNNWAATLVGITPIPLGQHTCPPDGTRYYVPSYLSPTGPPLPPPITDAFDRADGVPGANWSGGSIVSGKLRVSTGTVRWQPAQALPADQYIEARMWASSVTNWGYHGLVVRSQSAGNIQYRYTVAVHEGKYALEYIDADGKYTPLLSGAVTYVPGAAMRLVAKGGKLTIFYAFNKLGEVDDARISAGSVGVIGLPATGQYAEFDDVVVGPS